MDRCQPSAALPICAASKWRLANLRTDEEKSGYRLIDAGEDVTSNPAADVLLYPIQPSSGDRDLGLELTTDGQDADPPEALWVESRLGLARYQGSKRDANGLPLAGRLNLGPKRLPGPRQLIGAQADIVGLTVAAKVQLNPVPSARVDPGAIGPKIKSDLDEAAVVVERDIAAQNRRFTALVGLARHAAFRDAAHYGVGHEFPVRVKVHIARVDHFY